MKISNHITYAEATHSYTAKRLGISNAPNDLIIRHMRRVADEVFEPLRKYVGGAIKINSFYRSIELNKAIGGSSTSAHCKGLAIDIDDTYNYKSNAEMFFWIKRNLIFDQLIWEGGDDDDPEWVHIGLSEGEPRGQVLQMTRKNGKIIYTQF